VPHRHRRQVRLMLARNGLGCDFSGELVFLVAK
jgi:hypothetical protein